MRADGAVTPDVAREALALFEVDERGLDKVDRAILTVLCVTFAGRPVGLHTLAVAVAEEPDTIEEVYEPFLITAGLLDRTPRGRVATPEAYAHLALPLPAVTPPNLFEASDREAGIPPSSEPWPERPGGEAVESGKQASPGDPVGD